MFRFRKTTKPQVVAPEPQPMTWAESAHLIEFAPDWRERTRDMTRETMRPYAYRMAESACGIWADEL